MTLRDDTLDCAVERVHSMFRELCRTGGVMTPKDQKKYGVGAYPELNESRRLRVWRSAIERTATLYGLEFDELARRLKK